jgi:dihydropteroate synthase
VGRDETWQEKIDMLAPLRWQAYSLDWEAKTYIMGVVNVTPDSFSRDGLLQAGAPVDALVPAAVAQATRMVTEGADIIDVGGESTRPGAAPVSAEEEQWRVLAVIRALRDALPARVPISIDTYRATTARAAIAAGAALVNDIWGLRRDPGMAAVVCNASVPVILMSNQRGMPHHDVLSDTLRLLARSIDSALDAGIPWDHLIVDPGFGFGLPPAGNLELLRRLGELQVLGRPILLGTSRKSTIGVALGGAPEEERLEGTAATVALGIAAGANIVRVHDVAAMARVARVADAVVRGRLPGEEHSG